MLYQYYDASIKLTSFVCKIFLKQATNNHYKQEAVVSCPMCSESVELSILYKNKVMVKS